MAPAPQASVQPLACHPPPHHQPQQAYQQPWVSSVAMVPVPQQVLIPSRGFASYQLVGPFRVARRVVTPFPIVSDVPYIPSDPRYTEIPPPAMQLGYDPSPPILTTPVRGNPKSFSRRIPFTLGMFDDYFHLIRFQYEERA